MRKLLLALTVALLIPGMLSAAMMGSYLGYAPGRMNCPEQIGLQEESWGAIKTLYR